MKNGFSVGYSGSLDDLKRIIEVSDKVSSVYTGGLADKIFGGRPQYIDSMATLSKHIEYAHAKGVVFEVALNGSCGIKERSDKAYWSEIRNYLKELEISGVDGVVVSHPFIMNEVKSHTNLKLTVSTICEISNVRAALNYEMLGADIIVPSMNINWNSDVLTQIKNALKKAKLKIMVNEHCLGDCPWRRFHHNYYSHSMKNADKDFHFYCKRTYRDNFYLLLTNNVIRPEDLKHFDNLDADYKIVGRLVNIDVLCNRIKAYTERRYAHNYVDLFDSLLAGFINIPNEALNELYGWKKNCSKNCTECKLCIELFDKISIKQINI
jgi:collagenase-like PrtC family protease